MFASIIAFLQGLIGPLFNSVSNIVTSIFSEKGTEVTQQAAVTEEVIKGEKAVEQKWWFVAIIPPLFAIPYAAYVWKAILWDKVIMNGLTSTDPIKDATLSWTFTMVVGYYLLHSLTRTYK